MIRIHEIVIERRPNIRRNSSLRDKFIESFTIKKYTKIIERINIGRTLEIKNKNIGLNFLEFNIDIIPV